MNEEFTVTKEMLRKRPEYARGWLEAGCEDRGRLLHAKYSRTCSGWGKLLRSSSTTSLKRAPFTHHSSIAPTVRFLWSLANNAERHRPSFAATTISATSSSRAARRKRK